MAKSKGKAAKAPSPSDNAAWTRSASQSLLKHKDEARAMRDADMAVVRNAKGKAKG